MSKSVLLMTQEESDSTKRLMEAVNLHVLALHAGATRDYVPFIACKMSDGSSDGTLYESRADAIQHHPHDTYMFYVRIGREMMSFKEAWLVLQINRQARARGHVFGREEQLAVPMMPEQISSVIPRTYEAFKRMK